jgi:hypothetical protein
MPTIQSMRQLTQTFIHGVSQGDAEAVLALCDERVEHTGLMVRQLMGRESGTLHGKEEMRDFVETVTQKVTGRQSSNWEIKRIAYGVRSVVVDVDIDGFAHLVAAILLNDEGKITQVHMHQALPQAPDSTSPGA